MDFVPAPLDELAAINLMLPAAGESPITSIDDIDGFGDPDSATALNILRAVTREVQEEGWDFNTDLGFTLRPNEAGHVVIPESVLSIDPCDPGIRLVQRGNRLYDPLRHTYVIGRTVVVDLVSHLSFDELPSAARTFIAIRAIRRFTDDAVTSTTVHRFKQEDEQWARASLERNHTATQDENLLPSWRYAYRNRF